MKIRHEHVEQIHRSSGPGWMVHSTITHDDGAQQPHRHIFPADIFEGRAAEYGIDPADMGTLLDVVLWEPHLHHLADGVDHDHGLFIWNAPTIDQGREFHLRRIATVKAMLRHSEVPDPNPVLDVLRANHGIDHEIVALKAQHFALSRAQHAAQCAEEAPAGDRRALWQARVDALKTQQGTPAGLSGEHGG